MGYLFVKYRGYLLATLLFFYALAQVFSVNLNSEKGREYNWIEKTVVAITSPPQRLLTFTIDKMHGMFINYLYFVGLRKNYEDMVHRNRELVLEIDSLQEERHENRRLRDLLGFREKTKFETVSARVISFGNATFTHSLRLDRGSNNGVADGMPVVTAQGVVGHVIQVSGSYSDVMLLLDPASSIDSIDQNTRTRGILTGKGTGELNLEYVLRDADLASGSILLSSGLDGIYPKGLMIGTISEKNLNPEKMFMGAVVTPSVNFSRLEEVLVILNKTSGLGPMADKFKGGTP